MIRQVAHHVIAPWRAKAARERVDLKDTPVTRWFMEDGVACAGLSALKRGARIKGVYVDPAFRGQGIGTRLTEHLIETARREGAEYVEAFVWNLPWYSARQFEAVGRNRHAAILVKRIFEKDAETPCTPAIRSV